MIDESRLQIARTDCSLLVSKARSWLIARGRKEAALLALRVENNFVLDQSLSDLINYRFLIDLRPEEERIASWWGEDDRSAADQGYPIAQFNLGVLYDKSQDYLNAVEWYLKAAAQGLEPALYNLALKYDKGEGVGQDFRKAAKLYHQAAVKGFVNAQFNLGLKYAYGVGVVHDNLRAYFWLTVANLDQRSRDSVAAKMSEELIADSQALVQEFREYQNKLDDLSKKSKR